MLLTAELLVSGTSYLPLSYPFIGPDEMPVPAASRSAWPIHLSAARSKAETQDALWRIASDIQYDGDRYNQALRSLVQTVNSDAMSENRKLLQELSSLSVPDQLMEWCTFKSGQSPEATEHCLAQSTEKDKCAAEKRQLLPSADGEEFLCVNRCPNGTFKVESTLLCQPCRVACLECTALDRCQSCRHGYILHKESCVDRCPVGYYSNENEPQVSATELIMELGEEIPPESAEFPDAQPNNETSSNEAVAVPVSSNALLNESNEAVAEGTGEADASGSGRCPNCSSEPDLKSKHPLEYDLGQHAEHRYVFGSDALSSAKSGLELVLAHIMHTQPASVYSCRPCPNNCDHCYASRHSGERICERCRHPYFQLDTEDTAALQCVDECPKGFQPHVTKSGRRLCKLSTINIVPAAGGNGEYEQLP